MIQPRRFEGGIPPIGFKRLGRGSVLGLDLKAIAKARWIAWLYDRKGMNYRQIVVHLEKRQAARAGRKPRPLAFIDGPGSLDPSGICKYHKWWLDFRETQLANNRTLAQMYNFRPSERKPDSSKPRRRINRQSA